MNNQLTLYKFIALSKTEQANVVWESVLLETRIEGKFNVLLYDLGGFYVEVYYNDELKKIERLRPFKTVSNVVPYLTGIEISQIKNLL